MANYKRRIKREKQSNGTYLPVYEKTIASAVCIGDGTDDSMNLEKILGNFKGLTNDLNSTSTEYGLSATAGKKLQDEINSLGSLGCIAEQYSPSISYLKDSVVCYGTYGYMWRCIVPQSTKNKWVDSEWKRTYLNELTELNSNIAFNQNDLQNSYADGFNTGNKQGYDQGYTKGYSDGSSNNSSSTISTNSVHWRSHGETNSSPLNNPSASETRSCSVSKTATRNGISYFGSSGIDYSDEGNGNRGWSLKTYKNGSLISSSASGSVEVSKGDVILTVLSVTCSRTSVGYNGAYMYLDGTCYVVCP